MDKTVTAQGVQGILIKEAFGTADARPTGIPTSKVEREKEPARTIATSETKLRTLEAALLRLDDVRLEHTDSYSRNDIDVYNFVDWLKFANSLNDPDKIRNCLYYGFQPLYDILIEGTVKDTARSSAINALTGIVAVSKTYLTGYYTGQPDVKAFRTGLKRIRLDIEELGKNTPYRLKHRNIDDDFYPKEILSFIKGFLKYLMDIRKETPDYVIGCACGASEVAMPLAGILGIEIGFLRKSKRRFDEEVRVIDEQLPNIRQRSMGKRVVCVEDFVCSGKSIERIMESVRAYGALSVLGASVRSNTYCDYVQAVLRDRDFSTFRLRGHDE